MRTDPSAPLHSLAAGSIVDGTSYKVVRRIGEGGMGVVYEVEHIHTLERRALKILHRVFLNKPEYEERFMLEVRALERLNGAPHIVQVFESGRLPSGRPYYVMALVEGETLLDRLMRAGPLAIAEALIFGHQVLVGLQAVHREGIIHRDVKPQNIIVTPAREVVLLDFGLAKALTENGLGERLFPTEPGFAVGTGPYMPPELIYGVSPDERGDLYAAGVVLFECLAGGLPYTNVPDSNYRLHVARYGFPSLSEAGIPVPPGLERVERVVRRATDPNPDARLQTAADFATALVDAIPPAMLLDPASAATKLGGLPPSVALRTLTLAPAPAAPPATTDPIAPVLVAAAVPAPAQVAPRPPRPARLWWTVPVAFASFVTGVALVLVVMGWPGLPAPTARVVAERRAPARPDARSGAAPAVPTTPAPEARRPSDVKRPAAPATTTARSPSASASADRTSERDQLEAKLQGGRGTLSDARQLVSICHVKGDEACLRQAESFVFRLGGGQ